MRKTKIICTIGPASGDEEMLEKLMLSGMNVARLNFSHGTHEDHKEKIDRIKKIREKLGLPVAIMLDTKGPEYRIGIFENHSEEIKAGDTFTFTRSDDVGNASHVAINYKELADEMKPGDTILVNNGLLIFEVTEVRDGDVITKVVSGGKISDRKSVSFPGKVFSHEYLSEKDKADLLFGIENEVDFVACSFVSKKQDLVDVKKFLDANGGKGLSLIAKIENQSGIDNIEEICGACEGIMIGRGDMGVEIPYERLPAIQKSLITKCRLLGKRVITATEMLESMINNPRPTRAEISDVANAVYDGTSAVMLSGETAAGKYPEETLQAMAKIVNQTENEINYRKRFYEKEFRISNEVDAISHSTCALAIDIDARAIAVCSMTGRTVRMVSRFRPPVDIIGVCVNEKARRKLALSWGVTPVIADNVQSMEVLFYNAKNAVKQYMNLSAGDKVVITGGLTLGESGSTNTIRIETI